MTDEEFSEAELEWGRARALELFQSGVRPIQAANQALAELRWKREIAWVCDVAKIDQDSALRSKARLSASLGDLLTHKHTYIRSPKLND